MVGEIMMTRLLGKMWGNAFGELREVRERVTFSLNADKTTRKWFRLPL